MSDRLINNEQGNELISILEGIEDAVENRTFLQSKSVNPTTAAQTVVADPAYLGLSEVSVAAVALQSKTVTPGKVPQTIVPDEGYIGLSQVIVGKGGSSIMTTKLTLSALSWTGTEPPYQYDLGSSFADKVVVVGINENELDQTDYELIGKFMIVGGESGRYLYALQWHPSVDIPVIVQYSEEN